MWHSESCYDPRRPATQTEKTYFRDVSNLCSGCSIGPLEIAVRFFQRASYHFSAASSITGLNILKNN